MVQCHNRCTMWLNNVQMLQNNQRMCNNITVCVKLSDNTTNNKKKVHWTGEINVINEDCTCTKGQCEHTGWNTSKIISRLISLRFWLRAAPTSAFWSNTNAPKNSGGIKVVSFSEQKTSTISEMRQVRPSYYEWLGSHMCVFNTY